MNKIRPAHILFFYLAIVLTCAIIYCNVPSIFSKPVDFLTSIYFSTITITTVGYGDLAPASNFGKMLTAIEALSGIILIGLFLNAVWQKYMDRIAKDQQNIIINQQQAQNLDKIRLYYNYLSAVIGSYKISFAILTTPIEKREERNYEINPDFKFSDLGDLYKLTAITTKNIKLTAIEGYSASESNLFNELKYFLANFDLSLFPELYNTILKFMKLVVETDGHAGMVSIVPIKFEEGGTMKDEVEKIIKQHAECPDPDKFKSNILEPVIILYHSLKEMNQLIATMESEFTRIINARPDNQYLLRFPLRQRTTRYNPTK